MKFFSSKILEAPKAPPILPPAAIIDNFVEEIGIQRDFHYEEVERLRSVIEDATARLGNHKTALEACEKVLETVRVDQALTISHLDIDPERDITPAFLERHRQDVA